MVQLWGILKAWKKCQFSFFCQKMSTFFAFFVKAILIVMFSHYFKQAEEEERQEDKFRVIFENWNYFKTKNQFYYFILSSSFYKTFEIVIKVP
jgi:hypothetical protein